MKVLRPNSVQVPSFPLMESTTSSVSGSVKRYTVRPSCPGSPQREVSAVGSEVAAIACLLPMESNQVPV